MAVAGRLGTATLAAHQVVAQLWMLTSYVVDGFAVAGTVLGSRLASLGPAGAREPGRGPPGAGAPGRGARGPPPPPPAAASAGVRQTQLHRRSAICLLILCLDAPSDTLCLLSS